jgi:hypothetical protein
MTVMATITAVTAANHAAAAYQQLCGHLAYLGLKAAADALPGLLDEARDGRVFPLEALERLMGGEAAAAESRRLASRLHWAALPAPWRLEDSDFAAQPGADVIDGGHRPVEVGEHQPGQLQPALVHHVPAGCRAPVVAGKVPLPPVRQELPGRQHVLERNPGPRPQASAHALPARINPANHDVAGRHVP